MKISYRLLNEYIDLQSADPHKIAPAIAEHCFEVEFINEVGGQSAPEFTNVFAAEVLNVEKHPNADRLRVVRLNLGNKIIEPVVCGANNFEVGDIVALALPGAHIPQDVHSADHAPFNLATVKIRGIESQGMICSKFELGLSSEPEIKPEILILSADIKPGTDLKVYFAKQQKSSTKEKDYLLDLAMPANRPDLHSHIGVAQELSGMLGYKKSKILQHAQSEMVSAKPLKYSSKSSKKVSIKNDLCGLYLGARIKVRVGETPANILQPLRTLGHSGVNNVVDITNFVMAETGQPLHAYDAARITGDIIVRSALDQEKITALDGKEYTLPKTVLVIADQQKALGIAGIIGGNQSKVTAETSEIILEAALFNGVGIRRASKAIGLRTDASGLFEKGVSQYQTLYAFNRAIKLLEDHAGGVVLETFGSTISKTGKVRIVKFSAAQINSILGENLSDSQIKKILTGIGIVNKGFAANMVAEIPWYRQDIEDAAGLADEILRFVGMNNISKEPLQLVRNGMQYDRQTEVWKAKDAAAKLGYTEVQGYSFISAAEVFATGRDTKGFIKISNPLSAETEYLRRDLGEGLLKIASANAKHTEELKIFEVGFGYLGYEKEKQYIAFAVHKRQHSPEDLVAELKGDIESFVHAVGASGKFQFKENNTNTNFISFDLLLADNKSIKDLGAIAVIDSTNGLAKRFDLEGEVILCQLQLDALLVAATPVQFKSFSRFPESSLDLSVVVSEDLKWQLVEGIVTKASGILLKEIKMIDAAYFYSKANLSSFHKNLQKEGRKNLVFRLIFASEKGTLQDSEISKIYAKIKVDLETQLGAEIR